MKPFIYSVLIMTMICESIFAQQPFGTLSELPGDGYTYNKLQNYTSIKLYNKDHEFIGVKWAMKNGDLIPIEIFDGYELAIPNPTSGILKGQQIINSTLTSGQKTSLAGQKMLVGLYVDSTTGKVRDVQFSFFEETYFNQLPLNVFRSIEVQIKKEIEFVFSAKGKGLNYQVIFWWQEF